MTLPHPKIFVSIASYCDPELPQTLDNCLANARHPELLRFGICWQFDAAKPITLTRFAADPRFAFSIHRIEDSEGGSWARNIAQTFWDGEEYTLQIDSHMAFAKGWDESLVRMMRTLPADKPLITMKSPLFRLYVLWSALTWSRLFLGRISILIHGSACRDCGSYRFNLPLQYHFNFSSQILTRKPHCKSL